MRRRFLLAGRPVVVDPTDPTNPTDPPDPEDPTTPTIPLAPLPSPGPGTAALRVDLRVAIYSPSFRRRGEVTGYRYATCTLVDNGAGTAELQVNEGTAAAAWLAEPGARVAFDHPGGRFTGPVSSQQFEESAELTASTYSIIDDASWVLALPVPVHPSQKLTPDVRTELGQAWQNGTLREGTIEGQSGYFAWRDPGTREGAIKRVIRETLGFWGVTNVLVAPNQGRGGPANGLPGDVRFTRLDEVVYPIARAGGLSLIVQHLPRTDYVTVEVVIPKTFPQRATRESGIVRKISGQVQRRPSANIGLVLGAGEGPARAMRDARDAASIRIHGPIVETKSATSNELLVYPKDLDDAFKVPKYYHKIPGVTPEQASQYFGALDTDARKIVADGVEKRGLTIELAESKGFFYGTRTREDGTVQRGFRIGDQLTIVSRSQTFTERITEVTISATDRGETVTPSLGITQDTPAVSLARALALSQRGILRTELGK